MDEMFNGYSLTTGAVRRRDLAYLLGIQKSSAESDRSKSRVFVYSGGKWIPPVDLEWNARSCAVSRYPAERFLAMSEQGYVLALGGGQVVVEPRIAPPTQMGGPLTEIRAIGGRVYAVGTLRQAYLRIGPGQWRAIDQTCKATGQGASDFAFRTIDGFSSSDIYAAGWEGEIWRYDERHWTNLPSITNLALYSVKCAGDGRVYAVGQRGAVLRGRGAQWDVILHESTEDDLWSCEWFADRLFIASTRVLYELKGDKLLPVEFGEVLPPATCYHLSAADGIMWSIGASNVMQFDGAQWSTIL